MTCPVCGLSLSIDDISDQWPGSPAGPVHRGCRAEAETEYSEWLEEQASNDFHMEERVRP